MALKLRNIPLLFWVAVVVPTALSIIYYGIFASDVYVSRSDFIVRSPDKPETTGFGLLLKTTGFSNANDEIFATKDYLESRDALSAINQGDGFREAYSSPAISRFDRYDGFGFSGSFEQLYRYYQKHVGVSYDSSSSISTLTVKAYTPEDAQRFNQHLLDMAERTVNQMSERGRKDLINVAKVELEQAKKQAQNTALALASYRNREGIIDPEKQASVQMQMISKLQDELISTETQLAQLEQIADRNAQLPVLRERKRFLQEEIESQLGKVAGDRKSLAGSAVTYERLLLESQFADKQLAVALSSLEEAKSEARRKRAYLEAIVKPNRPDFPAEPNRLKAIFSTFLLGLVAWGILSMLLAAMLEHRE